MKVLILGLGSIGRRHAHCFLAVGAAAVAGFDPDEKRRAQFVQETAGAAFATEAQGLAWNPDLVVVASPNSFHIQQAQIAVASGKALLIEKPLGTDLARARELDRAIEKAGIYAHVGSNWKFHPALQVMKAWISEGRLGTVAGVQALAGQWLPDWHPWEDYRQLYAARTDLGGGAIFDTHELDYMTWLIGPVAEICGFKACTGALDISTEDVAACVLRFRSGALGVLMADYIQRVAQRRYHVVGSEGTLDWDHFDGHVVLHVSGKRAAERLDVRLKDINDMYVSQARRILTDLRTGGRPETPVSAMLRVLELQTRWHEQRQAALAV